MIIDLADIFTAPELAAHREVLEQAEWIDGSATAGHQAARVKNNLQIPLGHPAARQVGDAILQSLSRNPQFLSAALPLHILPPMFNRYSGGQRFGQHVDGAIRQIPGTARRIRTDLSATLFFNEPTDYDGGELVIEDTYRSKSVKLPAGHLVLYPATSLHHVTPVTRGSRLCAFFWIQSLVRDDARRSILYELDHGVQQLGRDLPDHPALTRVTGVYHNLLRQWYEL